MATLTLDLPPELHERLRAEAARLDKPVAALVREWLAERLSSPAPASDRERARAALRAAGLLAEPSPEMIRLGEQANMTLEEVRAALDRAGGQPLSELILEMRGPKE